MSHRDDEIRRLACEQLRHLPRKEDGDVLLAALGDSFSPVVRPARAVGSQESCSSPIDCWACWARPTNGAAGGSHHAGPARFAQGRPTLERLAHDNDGEVRRLTAVAIGELEDSQYEPLLIEFRRSRGSPGRSREPAAGSRAGYCPAIRRPAAEPGRKDRPLETLVGRPGGCRAIMFRADSELLRPLQLGIHLAGRAPRHYYGFHFQRTFEQGELPSFSAFRWSAEVHWLCNRIQINARFYASFSRPSKHNSQPAGHP